jgi:hypothetical protein
MYTGEEQMLVWRSNLKLTAVDFPTAMVEIK